MPKEFTVYGSKIVVSDDFDAFNSLRQKFIAEAQKASSTFMAKYKNYKDTFSLLSEGYEDGRSIILEVIQRVIISEIFIKAKVYDLDINRFCQEFYKCPWGSVLQQLISKYEELSKAIDSMIGVAEDVKERYDGIRNKYQKSYNSMITQPTISEALSSSLFGKYGMSEKNRKNFEFWEDALNEHKERAEAEISEATDRAEKLQQMQESLYTSQEVQTALQDEMFNSVAELWLSCWRAMEKYGLVTSDSILLLKVDNIKSANSIVNNMSVMDKNDIMKLLPEIFLSNPYNEDLYVKLFRIFGDEKGELREIARFFGQTQALSIVSTNALLTFFETLKSEFSKSKEDSARARKALIEGSLRYGCSPKDAVKILDDFISQTRRTVAEWRESNSGIKKVITCVVCWIIAFFLFKLANTHGTQTIGPLAGIIGLGFVLLPFNDITDTKARREKSEQKRRNDNAKCILDNWKDDYHSNYISLPSQTSTEKSSNILPVQTETHQDILDVQFVDADTEPELEKSSSLLPDRLRGNLIRRLVTVLKLELMEKQLLQESPFQERTPKNYEPVNGITTDALIKRAFLFLEDGQFDDAGRYFDQALNQDPEDYRIHLGQLILACRFHSLEELVESFPTPLDENRIFQRALRFASGEDKTRLENYARSNREEIEEKILENEMERESLCVELNKLRSEAEIIIKQERLAREAELERIREEEEAEKEKLYQKIMAMKNTASTVSEIEEVLRLISSLRPYKDTQELYNEVIEALYKEKDYQRALETKRNAHELEDCRSLVYKLEHLNGYKDSEKLLTEAREALNKAEQHKRRKKVIKVIVLIILAVFAYFSYSKYSERLAHEHKQQELKKRRIAREEAQRHEVQSGQPSRAEKAFRSGRELELSEAYAQARQYYRQAVELGHPEAQKYLTALERKLAQNTEQGVKASIQGAYAQAESYLNAKNYSQAVEIFRRLANEGYAPAQDKLAWMYQNGWGVEQSYTQAVSWFRKAAEQGNTEALASMGLMYLKGWGVPQNYDTALEWYGKAASQGSEVAQRRINSIQLLKVNMQKLLASTEQGIGFPIAGTIFAETLSVRQSPNTSSKRVKTLKTGHPVSVSNVSESDNDYWFYVKTASGTEGWVLAGYVNLIDRDLSYQETTNKKHSLPASGYVTTREDTLNLRNIPTVKGSQVVEKLDSGTYFTAYEVFAGDTIDWYRIRTTEGDEGWVSGKYIELY